MATELTKIQMMDIETGQNVYPVSMVQFIEGLEEKLDKLKEDLLGEDLKDTFDMLESIKDWSEQHGTQYQDVVTNVENLGKDVQTLKNALKNYILKTDIVHVEGTAEDKVMSQKGVKGVQTETSTKITGVQTEFGENVKGVQGQLDTMENRHVQDIKGVQGQISGVQTETSNKITNLINNEIKGVQGESKAYTDGEITTVKSQVTGVQGELKTYTDGKIEGVQGQITGVQTELNNMDVRHVQDIKGVQGQIDALNFDVSFDEEIKGVQTETTGLIKGVQGQLNTMEIRHDADIKGVQGQLDWLFNNSEDGLDSIIELANWVEEHKEEVDDIKTITGQQIKGVQGELKDYTDDKIEGVQGQIDELIVNIVGIDEEIKGVQGEFGENIKGVQTQLNTMEIRHDQDIKGVQGQITGVQTELNNMVIRHDADIKGVQGQLDGLSFDVDIDEELKGIQGEFDKKIDENVKGVQGQLDTMSIRHADDIKGVQGQIDELIVDIVGLDEKIRGVQTETLDIVDEKVGGLNTSINNVNTTLSGEIRVVSDKLHQDYYSKDEVLDMLKNKKDSWFGTYDEYEALGTYDDNVVYYIIPQTD